MRLLALVSLAAALAGGEAARAADTWVLNAAKIYPAPDAPAISDGVVVIRDGKILAVGARGQVTVPKSARISECSGGVVTAGFQNSHVHFIEARWNDPAHQSAQALTQSLDEMLSRYGFTTVLDTGSDQANTIALRARIEKGEVRGPRILTAGLPLFPPDGIPFYMRDMPPEFLARLHQPRTAEEARQAVRENLANGANATKLFVVTPIAMNSVRRMSLEVARAAVEETHRQGKLVFAHPTDLDGIRVSLAAGVDVIVHTTLGEPAPWDDALLKQMITQHMSVIPTFKLWVYELAKEQVPHPIVDKLVGATLDELRGFQAAGGQILFGTDVGYMHEYDPSDEYTFMSRAGMTPMQILASLTTAPAARWQESERRGRIVTKADADLVVLASDPLEDVTNFAKVRCAFRAGAQIYSAPAVP
jgi:imidazolonepropionase-like amidohydrolase